MIFVTWSLASSCWTARNRLAQSCRNTVQNGLHHEQMFTIGVTADVSGASLTPFSVFSVGLFGGYLSASEQLFVWADRNRQSGQIRRLRTCIVWRSSLKLGSRVGIPIIGRISTDITSANALGMAFGGGIDTGLTRPLAIRAVHVDYLRTSDALTTGLSSSLGNRQNSFRYSTGIVFRF